MALLFLNSSKVTSLLLNDVFIILWLMLKFPYWVIGEFVFNTLFTTSNCCEVFLVYVLFPLNSISKFLDGSTVMVASNLLKCVFLKVLLKYGSFMSLDNNQPFSTALCLMSIWLPNTKPNVGASPPL